ncbi:unnamed protein product [Ilex paraguariensis]|uniref:Pectinesterase inhibitor domain-containing protein n=1 Tax=Ilex paraguariensis TaxID=185542 RepID=A0ABC8UB85_9AQUA
MQPQRSNLQKLSIASINLIQKNVVATIGDINKQLKRDVQRSITECLELYTQTIDDLSDAVKNYKSKSFYDVTQDVSATSVAATACEDGFKEREVVSILTIRNDGDEISRHTKMTTRVLGANEDSLL